MKILSPKVFDECIDYFNCCNDDENITELINGLIERFPEEIYESWSLYALLFVSFACSDQIVNRFFQDSVNDTDMETAVGILKYNIAIKNKVKEMWNVIKEIKQELADLQIEEGYLDDFGLESPSIKEEYLLLVIFLLIGNQLIYKYISIWENEYDSSFDFWKYYTENQLTWKRKYSKECIAREIISFDDNRGILALSYFLAKKDISIDYYKRIFDVVLNLREIKYAASHFIMKEVTCTT